MHFMHYISKNIPIISQITTEFVKKANFCLSCSLFKNGHFVSPLCNLAVLIAPNLKKPINKLNVW